MSRIHIAKLLIKKGNKAGALSQWEDGIPLSKTQFVDATRQALSAAHLPAKDYAGNSFRIRAATIAALTDLEDYYPSIGLLEEFLLSAVYLSKSKTSGIYVCPLLECEF